MNFPSLIPVSCRPRDLTPRSRAGLTILEMLVSTAMLAFIVLGLTAVFIQTQKAFKSSIKQNTITDAGRSIMDMITGDLREMADSQNTNLNIYAPFPNTNLDNPNFNFYWNVPPVASWGTNYVDGAVFRVNQLDSLFILEHTNTTWVGVAYAISNYPGVPIGSLYRYETNVNTLIPVFANDLFSPFLANMTQPNFSTNYWHKVADGVVDLEIHVFDQYGNPNDYDYIANANGAYSGYPIFPTFETTNSFTNTLPNTVEVEFGILEPDTLVQVRGLAATPAALANFLSSNATPNMEVFRQRVTIAAASR